MLDVDATMLNMLLNIMMIVALLGLWVVWIGQARQRQRVEKLLMQAAHELEESSRLLDAVMLKFPEIKAEITKIKSSADSQARLVPAPATEHEMLMQQRDGSEMFGQHQPALASKKQPTAERGMNISAQIQRLHREGADEQKIADTLAMPIAQVRLMLLLQAPKV